MTIIEVRQGSVTDADVDVLVNASNTLLRLGSGVSAAIRAACGPAYQAFLDEELKRRGGGLAPGDVVITHAGTHRRARFVAHVAVMDYRDDASARFPDAERIERASAALWRAIEQLPPPSSAGLAVGMVALGAGTGSLGVRLPTEIACRTLKGHLASPSRIARVVFHGFSLIEHVNVLDVVSSSFDVDMTDVSAEVRDHLAVIRAEAPR